LAQQIDVPAAIDGVPVGRFQIGVLLACAAVLMADGFDTQAVAFVGPSLIREWGISRAGLAPLFSAGLVGLMLGALVLSPLADRIGRRVIILASTLFFGGFTLATAFAPDADTFLVLRLLTGLGLGGAMPNAVALTAEYSPARRRTVMVMVMFCGFSVGGALGGALAAWLIPAFGWRAVFMVGGAVPLLMAPVLMLVLPESVRFLALARGQTERVATLLRRINRALSYPPGTSFGVNEPHPQGLPLLGLFREGRAAPTLVLWVVFFMSLLDLYFLAQWIPTVVNGLGASVSIGALAGATLQVGGICGTLSLGWIIERHGASRILAATYLLAAVSIVAVGQVGGSVPLLLMAIFGAGFGIVGAQIGANAFAASFYPTAFRSTGVGWALGIGRIGSIIGPLLGGLLIALKWTIGDIFLLGAIPALVACLAALALGAMGRGRAVGRI
jgi:AAHS family 4-hydroxybenzoate transporter-like MFS transporter